MGSHKRQSSSKGVVRPPYKRYQKVQGVLEALDLLHVTAPGALRIWVDWSFWRPVPVLTQWLTERDQA